MRYIKGDFVVTGPDVPPMRIAPLAPTRSPRIFFYAAPARPAVPNCCITASDVTAPSGPGTWVYKKRKVQPVEALKEKPQVGAGASPLRDGM